MNKKNYEFLEGVAAKKWSERLAARGESRVPKWRIWANIPKVRVWEAIALSLGIEPTGVTQHKTRGADRWLTEPQEFKDRINVATQNAGGALAIVECGRSERVDSLIRLDQFCDWAMSIGWSLPPEMLPKRPALSSKEVPVTTTHKPLGETREQTLLKQVALLALVIAEHGKKYKLGSKPNKRQIADVAITVLKALPDAPAQGLASSSLRRSINDGLDLLSGTKPAASTSTEPDNG